MRITTTPATTFEYNGPCNCDCDDCDDCHPVTLDVWRVSFHAHCGMSWREDFEDECDARSYLARELRSRRRSDHTVVALGRRAVRHGKEIPCSTDSGFWQGSWECTEPESAVMVPDTAGIFTLSHVVERAGRH